MIQRLHVHIVDSNSTRRAAIARELYGRTIHVEIYEDLDELLDQAPSQGLVLLHPDYPFLDEMHMIEAVRDAGCYLPVAFYSAQPSPEKIVQAIHAGAIDYLQWPTSRDGLENTIMHMARTGEERSQSETRKFHARQIVGTLTQREREVLVAVVEGDSNKEIAKRLGISPRTVEVHRGNMMSRLNARSTAEAVRIGLRSGLVD
jgi:FixJ family two-component response regulator